VVSIKPSIPESPIYMPGPRLSIEGTLNRNNRASNSQHTKVSVRTATKIRSFVWEKNTHSLCVGFVGVMT